MSSGNFHEGFNLAVLSISFFVLVSAGLLSDAAFLFFAECVLFWVHGYFHTMYVTPDNDTNSNSTKKLGTLGKIINIIFPHHGLLHDVIFWVGIYIFLGVYIWMKYQYVAWWFCGGVLASLMHIFVDGISTRKRKFWRKVKKTIHFI